MISEGFAVLLCFASPESEDRRGCEGLLAVILLYLTAISATAVLF